MATFSILKFIRTRIQHTCMARCLLNYNTHRYNCISLGLLVWALAFFCVDQHILGSIAFCLAVNYKQMELYHAVPFFCYLLGICIQKQRVPGLSKLTAISLTVLATFIVCWLPFLSDFNDALQVLQRLFPFDRGLYEDKVANIWCSLSVVVKLKSIFSVATLARISLATTAVCLLPSSLDLLRNPTYARFRLALINSSLIFFLVSFQVHEKSILLAAIPVCLILHEDPFTSLWFLIISWFSLYPLLFKDNLAIPFYSTCVIYACIVIVSFVRPEDKKRPKWISPIRRVCLLSLFGALALSFAAIFVTPPKTLPDLHSVMCSIYSCAHFVGFALYYHYLQFSLVGSRKDGVYYTKKRN